MLRKLLMPAVIVSILLLLTTFITIAKTEVASVVTSETPTSNTNITILLSTTTTATPTTATTSTTISTTKAPSIISKFRAIKIPTRATTTTTIKPTTPRYQRKITIVHARTASPKGARVFPFHGRRKIYNNSSSSSIRSYNKRITSSNSSNSNSNTDINNSNNHQQKLLNNADETTTSLLPLQPTLSVTPTTLPSLILHQEQDEQQQQLQYQEETKVNLVYPQKELEHEEKGSQQDLNQWIKPEQEKRQNRQKSKDPDVTDTVTTTTTATATTKQQSEKHLINVAQSEDDNPLVNVKENPHDSFANVELVTAVPVRTHAYIPFDLDYSDPTEEKSRPPEAPRQSTINEVLSSLFPKGFSDIFRFSYAPDTVVEEQPPVNIQPIRGPAVRTTTIKTTYKLIDPVQSTLSPPRTSSELVQSTPSPPSTSSVKSSQIPINVIKSTPAPFKLTATSSEKSLGNIQELLDISAAIPFKPMPTIKPKRKLETKENSTESEESIVLEKILADLGGAKSSEEFRDGSNSLNKDELLRINRAAKQASVLPSMLLVPNDVTSKTSNKSMAAKPIVILTANDTDDFIEAPEDDNQIAESQNIAQGVYHSPPSGSSSYLKSVNPDINVHIVHDDNLKKLQDNELQKRNIAPKTPEPVRNFQSYQSFVEQAKFLQNSLEEAPSRKFLKNFNPTLTRNPSPSPVTKGNFHYEQAPESHIQTVPPAAQLQYVLLQRSQEPNQPKQEDNNSNNKEHYSNGQNGFYIGSESDPNKEYDNQMHYFIQLPNFQKSEEESNYNPGHPVSSLHTHIMSEKEAYQTINNGQEKSSEPVGLLFVTISPPEGPNEYQQQQEKSNYSNKGQMSPSDYVHKAINSQSEHIADHQPEETENNPKPSRNAASEGEGKGGYTFVEVQKSINIHNKLITERDGRLIEQHETIYPPPKYGERLQSQHDLHNYVSLSQNPIHVEGSDPHEPAESLHSVQRALDPSQSLIDISSIQQSELIQESHIVENPIPDADSAHHPHPDNYPQPIPHEDNKSSQEVEYHEEVQQHEEHHVKEQHDLPEPSQNPDQPPIQVPYALPEPNVGHGHPHPHYQQQYAPFHPPLILQEVIEKHVHIPYAVPEPVAYPVPVQHFIDRPVPVETIVEKRVPYPVEKVVEKVVEKHVPVEVEKIVEKPVDRIVEKYIDRPVAVPIKIPVALQVTTQNIPYPSPYHPSSFGGSGYSSDGPWSQQSTFKRIPTKVLQNYYSKMLKKLVPQMTQAFKTSPLASKPKMVPKFNAKPKAKQTPKIGDMRFDLKPPPPPVLGPSWDVGARYQYDYNTLPLDLSASSSTAVGKQSERPAGGFDEFQRWRNGHSLKRSPELGTNLHVEYGFKPPLVPSVEIDDKGVPLRAASDLTKGKDE